ncbi:MspA family porin [Nocardia bovistercoris]|uniref:MspA family porin n=1 Tax=Nocardia bovistercoris TaxID=2785916 RepID=A0A931I9H1_9NOCA|nr:MspA family porin [Nocardia bovistercoris]MBH0777329.1 MspA family porin [Nocardia bovistercoris]
MLRIISTVGFTASALVVMHMPTAHAEILNLPPHEKTFESEMGSFTVGNHDEAINRIVPLNGAPTSYEALVSSVAYGRVEGQAEGILRTGYSVGCAARIDAVVPGIDPTTEFDLEGPQQNYATEQAQRSSTEQTRSRTFEQSSTGESARSQTQESGRAQEFESGQVQEFNGPIPSIAIDPGPYLELALKPGDITNVDIGKGKPLIPGRTVQIITRDFHIKVDSCAGPVTIRQYTYVEARTPDVDDSGAVFGEPTRL